MFKGIMKSLKNLLMNGKLNTVEIVVVFAAHERRFFYLYHKIIKRRKI